MKIVCSILCFYLTATQSVFIIAFLFTSSSTVEYRQISYLTQKIVYYLFKYETA